MKNNTYEATFTNVNAVEMFTERVEKIVSRWEGIAVNTDGRATVSVYGCLGSMDYDCLTANLEMLKNNKDVKSVTLHINSPGGAVAGLFDCCDYIKSFDKPINAYISGMACSAAYAIATSCDKVYSQQDAETGCCGCYAHPMENDFEKMGLLHRVFRSKNAPRKNLSVITNEEEAEKFQASIDAMGEKYLQYVADCRGVSLEDAEKTFGQGASVSAEYALANGMIDGICSIEEVATTDSSLEEGEGEDMDISTMSAEEQATLFAELCNANPSLVAERVEAARAAETQRVSALNALRNGSEAINTLVDAAVTDGRTAESIAFDVIKAMNEDAKVASDMAREEALKALADNTETVAIPSAKSEDQLIKEMAERL